MKIIINKCYGGFSLSEKAYERLIELGIPAKKYIDQKRNLKTGLYEPEPANDGEVIFDRSLSEKDSRDISLMGRYWDDFLSDKRNHPLLIRVIEELGLSASGKYAKLSIVEIPDGIEYEINEYDGLEHIAEKHRTWD